MEGKHSSEFYKYCYGGRRPNRGQKRELWWVLVNAMTKIGRPKGGGGYGKGTDCPFNKKNSVQGFRLPPP